MRLAAAALVVLAGTLPAAAEGQDPWTLSVNPLKGGLDGWDMVAGDKVFSYTQEESSLVIKGKGGKEVPRLFYKGRAWDEFEAHVRAKKFASKLRLALFPQPEGPAVVVEVPSKAVAKDKWNELVLKVGDGKAVLLSGTEEVAASAAPKGTRFRFGFEAPSGTSATVSDLRLVRRYVNPPQVCEEGFTSLFDGSTLGSWQPQGEGGGDVFSVENGILTAAVRTPDFGMIAYAAQRFGEYELRFRCLWGTNALTVRAIEVPGTDGHINKFDTVQVALTDNIDPDDVNDVVVRVTGGRCAITVNGKDVYDQETAKFGSTRISFNLPKGKKFLIRDLRVKDLAAK